MTLGPRSPYIRSQREAMPWLLERPKALYAAGMGLAKTRSMLELFQFRRLLGEVRAMVVIAPRSVALLTWPAEAKLWAPHLKVHVMPKVGYFWSDSDVYVLNYENIHKLVDLVNRTKVCAAKMLVLDECTCARSPSAKRMQLLGPILRKVPYVYGLTGTPTPNSYHDLYGQFKAIFQRDSPFGTNIKGFEREFFDQDYNGWNFEFREEKRQEFLHLIRPYMLTQKQSEYLDLPDVDYIDIEVPLGRGLMGQYRAFKKTLLTEIDGKRVTAVSAAVLIGKLLQFTSGKVFNEDKEVLFSHDEKHKALARIKDRPMLVMRHFTHTKIRGAVEFKPGLDEAWNRGEIPLMAGHPKSMGIGLNLQAGGHTMCWFSMTHSLLYEQQAVSRLHRTGQENPVRVYRLICPGTVDEAVKECLRSKDGNQSSLMTALQYVREKGF